MPYTKTGKNIKCLTCGVEFYTYPSEINKKYCSIKCKPTVRRGEKNPNWKGGLQKRICEICGKDFYAEQYRIKEGKARYCSSICVGKSTAAKSKELFSKRIRRVCAVCKKEIFITPFQSKWKNSYCSRDCWSIGKSNIKNENHPLWKERESRQCLQCGNEFLILPYEKKQMSRKFCSISCHITYRTIRNNSTGNPRGKGGKRIDLENRYFRSAWEANYARYLNRLISVGKICLWEYEKETFYFNLEGKHSSYTPDFKVYKVNGDIEYHEVKGWMNNASSLKLRYMKEYYPEIKITLIDRVFYRDLEKNASHLISNWEYPKGSSKSKLQKVTHNNPDQDSD